jgi:hypothetical protein
MIIAVAGKYSAETEAERQANFDAMNQAAARLLELGHTPLIGVKKGANRERDHFIAGGKPVYYSIEEIPQNL